MDFLILLGVGFLGIMITVVILFLIDDSKDPALQDFLVSLAGIVIVGTLTVGVVAWFNTFRSLSHLNNACDVRSDVVCISVESENWQTLWVEPVIGATFATVIILVPASVILLMIIDRQASVWRGAS